MKVTITLLLLFLFNPGNSYSTTLKVFVYEQKSTDSQTVRETRLYLLQDGTFAITESSSSANVDVGLCILKFKGSYFIKDRSLLLRDSCSGFKYVFKIGKQAERESLESVAGTYFKGMNFLRAEPFFETYDSGCIEFAGPVDTTGRAEWRSKTSFQRALDSIKKVDMLADDGFPYTSYWIDDLPPNNSSSHGFIKVKNETYTIYNNDHLLSYGVVIYSGDTIKLKGQDGNDFCFLKKGREIHPIVRLMDWDLSPYFIWRRSYNINFTKLMLETMNRPFPY